MSTEEWLAIISGWLVASVSWFSLWHQITEKRRERKAKEAATNELASIKRRGDAPYLVICNTVFQRLYHKFIPGSVKCWESTNGNVICYNRDEVNSDMVKGQTVIFVVRNTGESARSAVVKLDDEAIVLKQEVEFGDAKGLQFLEYPYDPAKHGKDQRLTIAFETSSGVHDTHIYTIRHGFKFLVRVDPALPQ